MKRGKEKVLPPGAHLPGANWLVEYVAIFGVEVQEPVSPRSSPTAELTGTGQAPPAASASSSSSPPPLTPTLLTALQLADPNHKIAGDLLHRHPPFDHPTQEFPVSFFACLLACCRLHHVL
jgi:hypothetical protein